MGRELSTALAQICAEQFDVAPDSVAVAAGDTAVIPYGQGGFASRQTVTAGSAVHLAAVAVRDKALKVAAHLLEANPSDLEFRDGGVDIAGAPGSGLRCANRRSRRRRSRLFHAGKVPARLRKACRASCRSRSTQPPAGYAMLSRWRWISRPAA